MRANDPKDKKNSEEDGQVTNVPEEVVNKQTDGLLSEEEEADEKGGLKEDDILPGEDDEALF